MKQGITTIPTKNVTLSELIETYLLLVPTDSELKDTYVDPNDRRRIRHRALIAAVLDACFYHDTTETYAEGFEGYVGDHPNSWSELADARRDFLHDVERLNSGKTAELVLKPTNTDDSITENPIKAKVKELIVWLVVIHLWSEGISKKYHTQYSIISEAAKFTGRSKNSIKTELSNYARGIRPSTGQIDYFWQLVNSVQQLARKAGNERDAFHLLLPAARALSNAPIRVAGSAHSLS